MNGASTEQPASFNAKYAFADALISLGAAMINIPSSIGQLLFCSNVAHTALQLRVHYAAPMHKKDIIRERA